MGKRSNFERQPRDYYPTPYDAVIPLLPFLQPNTEFIEPCAGDGRLITHLEKNGHKCVYACDIEPQSSGIEKQDVLFFDFKPPVNANMYITNPPWEREALHAMIDKFRNEYLTALLFDADWMFTKQAAPLKKFCQRIITVGRVSWMENGQAGMDNCCWYIFQADECETIFI